jgi:hypothetical protein
MSEICEYCQEFSGRIQAGRECCELRELALSPPQVRSAVYARMAREDGGAERVEALRERIRAERQRYRDWRESINRKANNSPAK